MDHNQAVELQLAVKYVLGELPPVQRDEYEDHYIDCPDCAKDVYAVASLTDTVREVFSQEARKRAPAPVRERGGWFAWLKPAFAAPAFAVLVLFVVYQNAVTIPEAKRTADKQVTVYNATRAADKQVMVQNAIPQNSVMVVASTFPLHALNGRRGSVLEAKGEDKIEIRPEESVALLLNFTPDRVFDGYIGRLMDSAGKEVFPVTVPGSSTNKRVQLAIPAGVLKPGAYSLVFAGDPGAKGRGEGGEVLRYSFSVAFLQ